MSSRGRPFGEVSLALLGAARVGPGTVVQLAERACVGYATARYTASRLVSTGVLARAADQRPAVLCVPHAAPDAPPAQWWGSCLGLPSGAAPGGFEDI